MGFRQTMMRRATAIHVKRYRKTKGASANTVKGLPVLLLTVQGRRSGTPHTTPLVYIEDAGSWVVSGSAGGQPKEPEWFRNLRATDSATVEIGERTVPVDVRIADADEHDRLWQRLVAVGPFFDGYQKKTTRIIPIAVLTPKQ
jgi:deazaflavin-dependent oxidoreductase (nitroreductase family)